MSYVSTNNVKGCTDDVSNSDIVFDQQGNVIKSRFSTPECPDPETQPDGYSGEGGCNFSPEELADIHDSGDDYTCFHCQLHDGLNDKREELLSQLAAVEEAEQLLSDEGVNRMMDLLEYIYS